MTCESGDLGAGRQVTPRDGGRREDPGELRNLIDERPDDAERLAAYIRGWLETTPAYTLPVEGDESPSRKVLESLRSLGYVGDDD